MNSFRTPFDNSLRFSDSPIKPGETENWVYWCKNHISDIAIVLICIAVIVIVIFLVARGWMKGKEKEIHDLVIVPKKPDVHDEIAILD